MGGTTTSLLITIRNPWIRRGDQSISETRIDGSKDRRYAAAIRALVFRNSYRRRQGPSIHRNNQSTHFAKLVSTALRTVDTAADTGVNERVRWSTRCVDGRYGRR